LHPNRAAPPALRNSRQGVDARRDDELRTRTSAVRRRSATLSADFDQGVSASLARRPIVLFARQHEGVQRRPQGRAALGIEQAIQPDQPVHRLAQVQIAPLVRPVGLRQRAFGVDPVLKVFCDTGELAGVVGLRCLQQGRLGLAHGTGAQMLGSPGDHRDVLIADVAAGKRFSGLRQLLELARDPNPLGRGAARQLATPLQPGDDGKRPVGGIFAGIIEPPEPVGEDRLERVDARFPDLDQALA